MKRILLVVLTVGIFWLITNLNFEDSPQNGEIMSPVVTIVERSAPQARTAETKKSQQESSDSEASGAQSTSLELAQSTQLPSEMIVSSSDMSGQRDAWFSHYRNGFDGLANEFEGKVTITYPGYEGKFTVQVLIPPKPYERTSVPIFMFDEKNPAVNVLGGSGLEFSESDDGTCMVRFSGNSIRAFFHKKSNSEAKILPREEPNQITSVIFTFDPSKKKGSFPVGVRFSFESMGPTTTIGKLEYEVKQSSDAG